jgi:hypothetical protein
LTSKYPEEPVEVEVLPAVTFTPSLNLTPRDRGAELLRIDIGEIPERGKVSEKVE